VCYTGPTGVQRMNLMKRLLKHRHIDENGCWNWMVSVRANGYGQLNNHGRILAVHRVAAKLWMKFDLESDSLVLHKCNNKRCFNPEHLYIGDKSDNMNDYIRDYGIKNQNIGKQFCVKGHEFTEDNTRIELRKSSGKDRRYCRRCETIKSLSRTITGRKWLSDNNFK